MEGHCLCGAITVKVNDSDLFSGHRRGHFCHCRNCRRVAGGIFGTNLAIEADKVEITGKDNLKDYIDKDTPSASWVSLKGSPSQSGKPSLFVDRVGRNLSRGASNTNYLEVLVKKSYEIKLVGCKVTS